MPNTCPWNAIGGASLHAIALPGVHFDVFRLGFFGLGEVQDQPAILEGRLGRIRVDRNVERQCSA